MTPAADIDPNSQHEPAHGHKVRALAAPVLQLLYAHYYLTRPPGSRQLLVPEWRQRLEAREPQLVADLAASAQPQSGRHQLFSLACELGYWEDADNERFITDLPELPARLLELLEQEPSRQVQPELEANMRQLVEEPGRWVELLTRLRFALIDEWNVAGRDTVRAHCAQFEAKYRAGGDVIKALPSYHFIRFEKTATSIRSAAEHKELLVVPLYFAASGGFSFDAGGRRFVGFGLASENLFDDTRSKAEREAKGIKALADPTRLLLLTLIARYSGFDLTVGDLAQYLEVSQPTVSGHLKVLRESGLVEVERRGNRSLYRPDATAIRELLSDMADTLLPH